MHLRRSHPRPRPLGLAHLPLIMAVAGILPMMAEARVDQPLDFDPDRVFMPHPDDTGHTRSGVRVAQQETLKEKADRLRQERLKRQEEARQKKEKTKAQQQDCDRAKASLASYQRPRINLVDEQGNRVRATEEARQARLAEAKKQVAEYCSPP